MGYGRRSMMQPKMLINVIPIDPRVVSCVHRSMWITISSYLPKTKKKINDFLIGFCSQMDLSCADSLSFLASMPPATGDPINYLSTKQLTSARGIAGGTKRREINSKGKLSAFDGWDASESELESRLSFQLFLNCKKPQMNRKQIN